MTTILRNVFLATFIFLFGQSLSFSQNTTTWVSNDFGELYSVDLINCQSQFIGVFNPVMKDLAYNPADGLLYGLFSGSIYVIDPQNANTVFIDAITQMSWNGFFTSMTCDELGMLYIVTDAGFVYTYNTVTSAEGFLGILPAILNGASGDATFYNGELVFTSTSDELVTVDLTDLSSSYSNGTYVGITNVYGIVSYTNCVTDSSILLATPENDIYTISYPSLNTSVLCDDIVPGIIYGAATTTETGCDTNCLNPVTPEFILDSVICEGEVTLNFPSTSDNGITGNWVPPLNFTSTTSYQFFPDTTYCADTILHELIVIPLANTTISGEQSFEDTVTSTMFLGTPPNGSWSANCVECINENSGEFYPSTVGTGTYEICYIPNEICSEQECIDVIVYTPEDHVPNYIEAPNVFTPNNDLQNEVFQFTKYSPSLTEFNCTIVNRWGKVVAVLSSISEFWDGTNLKGTPVADGTYFCRYEALFQDGEAISGQGIVQLIRN